MRNKCIEIIKKTNNLLILVQTFFIIREREKIKLNLLDLYYIKMNFSYSHCT
jgi:hypothetical protein